MERLRKQQRQPAALMLGVVLLWQASAVVHLVTVSHEVCSHGKIVDECHDAPSRGEHGDNPSPHDSKSHDNCRLLDSLTASNAAVQRVAPPLTVWFEFVNAPSFAVIARLFCTTDLYLSAPCHSPPDRA